MREQQQQQQQQQESALSNLGITKAKITTLVALLVSLYFLNLSSPTFINFIVLPILAVILALLGAVWGFLHSRPSQIMSPINRQLSNPSISVSDTLQSRSLYPDSATNFSLLVSRSFDSQLLSFLDRVLDRYLLPLYSKFGSDRFEFRLTVRRTVWSSFERLAERLIRVDYVTLLTRDLIILFTQHLQLVRTRGSQKHSDPLDVKRQSISQNLHSCLQNNDSELDFIRQITDVFLCICMKEEDMRCEPLRILLREYFVNQVIHPAVKIIADPDVINQKIVELLQAQENMKKTRDTSYAYARTYEEFIKVINKCSDPEELKRIRYSIMLEIMQATAIRNMKYAQETQQDKLAMNMHASKGQRLRGRNLHKYINQCRCAITLSEKRLKYLTGEEPMLMNRTASLPGRDDSLSQNLVKVVYPEGMREILDNVELRSAFLLFLERIEDPPLCHLWLALEELETQAHLFLDNDIHAIVDGFLEPDSPNYVKLMSSKLEFFQKFSNTHDPSFLILFKEYIVQELRERFFSQFIESSEYQQFLIQNHRSIKAKPLKLPGQQVVTPKETRKTYPFAANEKECNVMDNRLTSLYERRDAVSKHLETCDALSAEDAQSLKKAYEELDSEVKQMEHYLNRTSDWIENLGNWCVEISSVEMDPRQYSGANPIFIIMVSPKLKETDAKGEEDVPKGQALGWVIPRTYTDFSELHQILSAICPKIRKELPVNSAPRLFHKNSFTLWETQRQSLNQYIQTVMQEQLLQESEALYSFLSPVSGQFKQTYAFEERPFLQNLTHVFKNPFSSEDFTEDDSQREQIAEYMFELVHELFELDGSLFKWIRRQIISIAHASFGGSIDRQLRLTAVWLISEPMLVYYLESFQEVLLKDISNIKQTSNRSDEEKTRSKEQAQNLLQTTLPDFLQEVLGAENARRGLDKLFSALQDPILNKHLLYSVVEQLVITCLPEIKQL